MIVFSTILRAVSVGLRPLGGLPAPLPDVVLDGERVLDPPVRPSERAALVAELRGQAV